MHANLELEYIKNNCFTKVIEIMGKRSISDDDIVRIFNTVKAMNPGPFKITDVVKDLKKNEIGRAHV